LAEKFQPVFDNIKGERFSTVLVGINVTMTAIEVAVGCDVKKDVGGVSRKGDGFFHFNYS
jgi:hypothetical protein